jgi:hypothetical protein
MVDMEQQASHVMASLTSQDERTSSRSTGATQLSDALPECWVVTFWTLDPEHHLHGALRPSHQTLSGGR